MSVITKNEKYSSMGSGYDEDGTFINNYLEDLINKAYKGVPRICFDTFIISSEGLKLPVILHDLWCSSLYIQKMLNTNVGKEFSKTNGINLQLFGTRCIIYLLNDIGSISISENTYEDLTIYEVVEIIRLCDFMGYITPNNIIENAFLKINEYYDEIPSDSINLLIDIIQKSYFSDFIQNEIKKFLFAYMYKINKVPGVIHELMSEENTQFLEEFAIFLRLNNAPPKCFFKFIYPYSNAEFDPLSAIVTLAEENITVKNARIKKPCIKTKLDDILFYF